MKAWKAIIGIAVIVVLLAVIIYTASRIYLLDKESGSNLAWNPSGTVHAAAVDAQPASPDMNFFYQ